MQQNARVVILTLDAARAAGLELARPLDALEAAAAASPSSSDYDSSSAAAANAGLNGKARPTPSTERSAALSSVDDDSESDGDEESDEEGGGERRRNGSGSDEASSSSTSSLFDRPAGFAAVALPAPPPALSGYRPVTPVERTRGVAATLLLAFLGARLNSAYSLNAFVETVAAEYRAGRAAAALLAPLTDEEMASVGADAGLKVVAPSKAARGGGGGGEEEEEEDGDGGERRGNAAAAAADDDAAPPAATVATAGSGAAAAGRALLSQWVSIAFMTMAQMGVPHALSKSPGAQGWAFAGGSFSSSSSSSSAPASSSSSSSLSPSEAAAEALALDRLVRATLRQLAEEQGVPSAPPSETLEAFKRSAAQRAKEEEESGGASSASAAASFMRISDPSLASTSSALEVWGMALGVSRATAEHVAAKAEEWGLLEDGDNDGGQGGNGKGGGDGDGGGDGNGNGASSSSASSSSSGSSSSFGSSSSSSSEMAAAGEQQS